ncbi:transcription factor grauzone-like [Toxorhynchites rutilus septentrionalis]|uniref:transcription factor grauzone-like n=1 Tax=Toxorhynchites rutilus septentrionalis TaxID=329112 RepID=UPI002478D48B|nr:transcription factor grauzone-like [Toxorhynchites rutilus septentrionalis]
MDDQIKEICRLCLDPSEKSGCNSIKDLTMRSKLQTVFKFELPEKQSFPCEICQVCSSKVDEFHSFHETVRLNQDQLKATPVNVSVPQYVDIKQELSPCAASQNDESLASNASDSNEENDMIVEVGMLPTQEDLKDELSESEEDEDRRPLRRKRKQRAAKLKTFAKMKQARKNDLHKDKNEKVSEDNKKIQEFFTISCEFCSEEFDSFDRLQKHTRKSHNSRGSLTCCNRVFYKKCKIIEHIDSHLNPNQFHCGLCNKSYSNKYYLDLHNLRKHCINEEKPYKCEKCGQGFPKEWLLKAHFNTHIQAECTICHKVLASASTLKIHMVNMHSGDSKHICDTCGQEFRTKLGMERHIKQHMGINPIERIQCHICSKWVNGKPNLKIHVKTVHSEENQTVTCDVCNQIYPNIRALSSHKRRVHVEEKFECEFCGKKFKRSIYLKEHRASHTGQSLYSCDVCGMTTNSNANLYSHKKSKHPEEWLEARKKAMANAYG